MAYSPEHKAKTRARIVEAARVLFNRDGFAEVTIDQVMAHAGLTRGGFYNHFRSKEELYAEAVASFLNGRGKTWRDGAGVDPLNGGPETVRAMISTYLSPEHARDTDGQCPMIALPSDVARATPEARKSYEGLLRAMIWLFEHNLPEGQSDGKDTARVLAALSVGGMVLSRTIEDPTLADEVREAARNFALASVDR
ncbi:TetR/AcrR family transcriptional regulator [Yoonia sediminilitoris]|uniref:TetR family transcriptional regulator n=1 Tax=Yoonia sediminilitoris TaxID=1286148 RepID=A0A2T6K547_9RHOB|nr:TetR/AcrR family transcriptional regulator [Yoonia sediminilitoris]PUB09786.1 TetR family transcriptional regulator [Yoonia sediminilitoris]RCW89566.1 TetR family transcriptional regulator [Yoonia sediminilitoris]